MSQLSDAINQVLDENAVNSAFNGKQAASDIWDGLDPEEQKSCGVQEIARRIKNAAASRAAERSARIPEQMALPFEGLDFAYPVDANNGLIKRTIALTRLEFQRIIAIREEGIEADAKKLRALQAAYIAVSPIWDVNPDWTFGQCCGAIERREAAE